MSKNKIIKVPNPRAVGGFSYKIRGPNGEVPWVEKVPSPTAVGGFAYKIRGIELSKGQGEKAATKRLSAKRPQRLPGDLAAICCYFNPVGWNRRLANYIAFRASLIKQGIVPYTIELALDDDPFVIDGERVYRIRGTRANHCLWQKERLLNIGISLLPASVDKVAFLDVDLVWPNPAWADRLCAMLEQFVVVQPFHRVRYYDASGGINGGRASLIATRQHGLPDGTPGFAWACRRSLLDVHGIFDRQLTGGGDCAWAGGVLGDFGYISHELSSDCLRLAALYWQKLIAGDVHGSVSYLPLDVMHLWHGSFRSRGYTERHHMLRSRGFRVSDVEIDHQGLLAWTRRDLADVMLEHFRRRREDG